MIAHHVSASGARTPTKTIVVLVAFLQAKPGRIHDRLQEVRTKGDWEGWLRFFLQGIGQVANEAIDVTRKIITLHEQHMLMITEKMGRHTGTATRLLE